MPRKEAAHVSNRIGHLAAEALRNKWNIRGWVAQITHLNPPGDEVGQRTAELWLMYVATHGESVIMPPKRGEPSKSPWEMRNLTIPEFESNASLLAYLVSAEIGRAHV